MPVGERQQKGLSQVLIHWEGQSQKESQRYCLGLIIPKLIIIGRQAPSQKIPWDYPSSQNFPDYREKLLSRQLCDPHSIHSQHQGLTSIPEADHGLFINKICWGLRVPVRFYGEPCLEQGEPSCSVWGTSGNSSFGCGCGREGIGCGCVFSWHHSDLRKGSLRQCVDLGYLKFHNL